MKRVLVIGLDGASWDILTPWILEKKLPTLEKLMKNGIYGKLESVIPSLSAPAWTSFATGKNPGKHGIFDFMTSDGRIVNSNDVRGKRIWEILSKNGFSCCVINFPVTYPPQKINGCMISSFLTPPGREDFTYPLFLIKMLKKYDYKIDIEFEKYKLPKDINRIKKYYLRFELLPEIYDIIRKRFETSIKLMKVRKWDFFVIVLKMTDSICHLFWDRKDILLEFFRKLDDYIKKTIQEFEKNGDECFLFVVSDHGFGPAPTKCINLYPLLKDLVKPPLKWKLMSYLFDIPGVGRIVSRVSKIWVIRKGVLEKQQQLGVKLWSMYLKDPKLRKRVIQRLRETGIPNGGGKVFRGVWGREEIYEGKYVKNAPDIIFLPKPDYKPAYLLSNKIFTEGFSVMPGDHTFYPQGVFIISGKNCKKNCKIDMEITDITPTILHIFNIPIPSDVDGRPLKDVFK